MGKLDFGQTVTLLANLGVIAGIIFLAIEVGQNQASLEEANSINRANSATAALEYFNEQRILLAQDGELAEIWVKGTSGSDLTPVEQVRFSSVCDSLIWTFVAVYQRYSSLGQHFEAEGIVDDARDTIQRPGLRECWEGNRATIVANGNEAFVNAVERH